MGGGAQFCDHGNVYTWNGTDGQRSLHLGQCSKLVPGRAMDYIEPTQAHCI